MGHQQISTHSSPWPGYWNPPTPCNADPWGPPFDGYIKADELYNGSGTGLLQDEANKGRVHIIDVRTNFENQGDVCPMQQVLGLPLYTETNAGHLIWQWPDGTWEEPYSVPFFIGFYWAGTPGPGPAVEKWIGNVRPESNPNFVDLGLGSYFSALVNQGEIKNDDTLIIMCQSGWRASNAAALIKGMGLQDVRVLHGGMLAWSDDWY